MQPVCAAIACSLPPPLTWLIGLAPPNPYRQLAREIKHYQSPKILLIDELGYLPLDKRGAELLFQVITKRYERGSIIITTNIAFKDWPRIFAGDATMTSALLDRLLHHAQPVLIEGDSYRSAKRK